jgi:serine kinase of HPr protein (carbohydrate metabolism regulator)
VSETLLVHATAVAIDTASGLRAVLLRGPSGSGKSDLGLRLIDAGARLVADDQTELSRRGELLIVRSPPAIAGLIEVRGIGIVRLEPVEAPLALIVDLLPSESVERLPSRATERVLGVDVPRLAVAPFEASAAAKVAFAVRALTGPGLPTITTN